MNPCKLRYCTWGFEKMFKSTSQGEFVDMWRQLQCELVPGCSGPRFFDFSALAAQSEHGWLKQAWVDIGAVIFSLSSWQ